MISGKRWTVLFFLAAMIFVEGFTLSVKGQAASKKVITFESLLNEMVSMEEMARYPVTYYTCRQESSHDRRSVSPDAPNWFANGDGYDGGNFIRIDTIDGRIEKVMLDESGPGVITRFWITSLDRQPVLRFYFDGAKEPQFVIPAYDMMQTGVAGAGKGLVIPHTSYSGDGSGGSTSFLPIPYAHGCRITVEIPAKVDKQPRYYQINYRRYESTAKIETFSKEIARRAQKKIEEVNRLLLNPVVPEIKMATSSGQMNLPVEGTNYKLQDIADKNKLCPWNDFNYGVDMSKPGVQEYYNSLLRKYAGGDYAFKELWTRLDVLQQTAISFTIPVDDCVFLSYKRK
jgi:hypothetical protein